MKAHKWAKEIIAWANGAEIECRHKTFNNADWEDVKEPMWLDDVEYRIKPQPKEPQYLYVYKINGIVRLVETGGLIEVHHKDDHINYIGKIKLEQE